MSKNVQKDGWKIAAGVGIFLVLLTFPIWFTLASGDAGHRPEPQLPAKGGKCVESRDYMKANHMAVLDEWRDAVVRGGKRIYVSKDNTRHVMSLVNTCLKCHDNKTKFCDRCHDYVGLEPYCWDCHVEPKEE